MLAISSGYKNDLVCALRTVSLTSFNFTARVGFITVLLSECVFVGKAGGGGINVFVRELHFHFFFLAVAFDTCAYYPASLASTCMANHTHGLGRDGPGRARTVVRVLRGSALL